MVKNPPAKAGDARDAGLILGWEDPLEKEMAPTPVFLLEKLHGQRNLVATVHGVANDQTRLSN